MLIMSEHQKKKASEEQKNHLISYLDENVALARNQFTSVDGKSSNTEKWNDLAGVLNCIGGSQKTGPQCKKYWEDLRNRVKEKYAKLKKFASQSGVNGLGPLPLNAQKEKIVAIMSVDAIEGDNDSIELGTDREVTRPSFINNCLNDSGTQELQSTSKKRKCNDTSNDDSTFLEKCLELREKKLKLFENFESEKIHLKKQKLSLKKEELKG